MRETDLHHDWWTRADHNRINIWKQVRNHPLSKTEMYIPVHRELHKFVPPITPLAPEIGRTVLTMLNDFPTHYSSLEASKALYNELYDTEAHEVAEHLGRQIPFFLLSQRALKARRL